MLRGGEEREKKKDYFFKLRPAGKKKILFYISYYVIPLFELARTRITYLFVCSFENFYTSAY